MPQLDMQSIITMFENRILKLEGRSFALTAAVRALMCANPDNAAALKEYLVESEETFAKAIKTAPDRPTATFVAGAKDLVSELLMEDNPTPPKLEVIPGGKSGD
jgi:hypothetical protein